MLEMDIWSRIFAEKFFIVFKVRVCTNSGGGGWAKLGRGGGGGGGVKITENVWTSFMDSPWQELEHIF